MEKLLKWNRPRYRTRPQLPSRALRGAKPARLPRTRVAPGRQQPARPQQSVHGVL